MIKSARRAAIIATLTMAVAAALPAGTASAASVTSYDVTCHVFQQWEFAGTPAQWLIRWETSGSSNGCTGHIYREDTPGGTFYQEEVRTITTTGSDASSWYEVKACAVVEVVDRNGTGVWGPEICS